MNLRTAERRCRLAVMVLGLGLLAALTGHALASPAAKQAKPPAVLSTTAPAPSAQALKTVAAEAAACLKCHEPIKAFRDDGKHQSVGCSSCHGNLAAHNANEKTRPATRRSSTASSR